MLWQGANTGWCCDHKCRVNLGRRTCWHECLYSESRPARRVLYNETFTQGKRRHTWGIVKLQEWLVHRERKERRSRQAVSRERGRRIKVPSIFVTSSAPKTCGDRNTVQGFDENCQEDIKDAFKNLLGVREKVGCVDSEQSRVVNCLCDPGNGYKLYETQKPVRKF